MRLVDLHGQSIGRVEEDRRHGDRDAVKKIAVTGCDRQATREEVRMAPWLRASPEAMRSVMAGMRDTPWSWREADVGDLCRRMGWTLQEVVDGSIAIADAGLEVPGHQVQFLFREGGVDDIRVRLTQSVHDEVTGRDRFIGDAFADAAAEGVTVLGEPTARQHTKPPTVRWRLDETSTVLVENVGSVVTVTWASNRFQDEWDQVTEAPA
ncbi:DUF6301 family protein [Actinoplanes missouriensis]|uniref:DUF6301 family protein n=1 Tax=Actinoplanes missouriensis TaxID=1866 RepID=UPI0033CD6C97